MTNHPVLPLHWNVGALIASLPFYVASVSYYCWCRPGFAAFLAFAEAFQGLPGHPIEPSEPTP